MLDLSGNRNSLSIGLYDGDELVAVSLVSDYIVEHIISFLILSSIAIWDYLTKSLLFT